MLWGLLAGAIPVIIHLLNRRRYRPVPWAAMRFLRQAIKVNARRIRIEDLILMALRILVFLLVPLAFALPILRNKAFFLAGRSHVCAVLLLDDSYSMNYIEGGKSRFALARDVARDIVGRLQRGDSVSVITMSERPRRLFREPTFDLPLARDQIGRLECSFAPSGAEGALALAREDVARARQSVRVVYLISDFQKGLLSGTAVENHLAALKKQADVVAVPIGEGYAGNLAATGLNTAAGIVAAGVPSIIHCRIRNFGRTAQRDYPVELYVDGRRTDRRWVTVPAGGEVDVTFLAEFRETGQHSVAVKIPTDSLPSDNARYLVVDVRPKVPVLLVSGETPAKGSVGATEYIGTALAPGWLLGETDEDRIAPTRIPPSRLTASVLAPYPMVFLIDVPVLDPTQVAVLERYVRNGGGLMIVPGERADIRFYNEHLYRSGRGLLPARIIPPGFRKEPGECFLSPENYDHPVLSVFAGQTRDELARTRFLRTLLLDAPTTSTIVCNFSTGRPAIVEKRLGKGRVMLFGSGLGRDWGDFVWKPSFLIFIRRAGEYLMRRSSEGLNLAVYETAGRFLRGGSAASVLKVAAPDGRLTPAEVDSAVGGVKVRYESVDRPGIYSFVSEGKVIGRFAANVDPRESDIGFPPMGLAAAPVRVVSPTDLAETARAGGEGSELWMICLKAALFLMILEVLFLLLFESREKKPGGYEPV